MCLGTSYLPGHDPARKNWHMEESSKTHWPCRHISAMSRRGSPFRWNRLSSWEKFSTQGARLTFMYNVTKKISILVCGNFYSQLYSVMNTFTNNPKHFPTSLLNWHRLLKRTTVHFCQSHLFIYFLFSLICLTNRPKLSMIYTLIDQSSWSISARGFAQLL